MNINIEGTKIKNRRYVSFNSGVTVGISKDKSIMMNAAERLLGLPIKDIRELAKDIIFGQVRIVLSGYSDDEIIDIEDKIISDIANAIDSEISKVGLKLINLNVNKISFKD
jgi:flotillin